MMARLKLAGAELAVRAIHLATRAQAWTVTAAMTIVVTAVGYFLIERYRPASQSRPAPVSAIPPDGVPS